MSTGSIETGSLGFPRMGRHRELKFALERFWSGEWSAEQLAAAARYTRWPSPPTLSALDDIAHGARHDRLDAYLAAWIASLPGSQRRARALSALTPRGW